MLSPSLSRITNRMRSSITELSFHGIPLPPPSRGKSVTHVSGTFCYLCVEPHRQRKIKIKFRRLQAAAGIRSIPLYDLRHTAATLAVAAGVSVKVISDQLGHASISFRLERYSHVLPSIQDESAAKVERVLMAEVRFTSF